MDAMSNYGKKMETLDKLQKKGITKTEVDKRQVQLAGEAVIYIRIHSGEVQEFIPR